MMNCLRGVDHAGIGVRNMERMKSYYRDVLGFTDVLGEMPEEDHPATGQVDSLWRQLGRFRLSSGLSVR